MASLQYVIDSICSSVTAECVQKIIEAYVSQGSFNLAEILPLIQSKDRSLDAGSAKMIAKAALGDLARQGILRVEGDVVYSAK
jgi:hypothetical protein